MYSVCIVNTSSLCIFNADKTSRIAKAVVNGVVVGGLAVVAAPLALSVAGFSAGGIVAGSLAAKLMSAPAIASGGSERLWFDRGCTIGRSCWEISWHKHWDWCWNRESRGACSLRVHLQI